MTANAALLASVSMPVTDQERDDLTYQLEELESQWDVSAPNRWDILDECIEIKYRMGVV